ncbi:hypothetical protein AAVH_25745, partial [Aphelenchoides avenae]
DAALIDKATDNTVDLEAGLTAEDAARLMNQRPMKRQPGNRFQRPQQRTSLFDYVSKKVVIM